MWPFRRKIRRQIGIDIGTSSVKIVELSKEGNHVVLSNYGIMDGSDFFGEVQNGSNTPSGLKLSENDIASVLKQLLDAAKIKTDKVVMSIPFFSSFLTVMEMPNISQKEIESAIPFQARSYIPVPLSEVVLDWLVIPEFSSPSPVAPAKVSNIASAAADDGKGNIASVVPDAVQVKKEKISVLLIAVPKEVVSKYQRIAKALNLELVALESESFSLARSLIGEDKGTIMLVDFGARSTNLTIIDRGYIFMSHSADLSGKEITKMVARSLNVQPQRAEELKKSSGVSSVGSEKGLTQIISPFVEKLVNEIERMNSLFIKKEGRKIEKIVLTGGSANLPGLVEYLSKSAGVEVIIGNPFSKVKFDPSLEPILRKDLSSSLAVATGLSMREI
jgi:type IV pilus assembly protein PilM